MTSATRPGLAVEVATWRPVEVVEVDGWEVGLSAGFTRRANSVVGARAPRDVASALDRTEALYADRGLPSVVRVCADTRPSGLDEILERRGYRVMAPTSVMVAPVSSALSAAATTTGSVAAPPTAAAGPADPGARRIVTAPVPDLSWLTGWLEVKASPAGVDLGVAARILQGSEAHYLSMVGNDGVAGVLRVAFAGSWVGLSCLMVPPRARRQGVARALTAAALDLASGRGSELAFLQVESSNTVARDLYRTLGFVVADEYHYRQR